MNLFLHKLATQLEDEHVHYFINYSGKHIEVNNWIGKPLSIVKTGQLQCLDCKKIVKKFYGQGLCYLCLQSSPLASPCILFPEQCEAHLGRGRDMEWEKANHLQPHVVYLANSGGLKVGVTRADQVPYRWIDQGADQAIILSYVPYRKIAGDIEVFLKKHLSDKTNWRVMLKNEVANVDLASEKDKYASEILSDPQFEFEWISEDDTMYNLIYPTEILTQSVQSINLEKTEGYAGVLTGIKGQYLIFDHKYVLNVRTWSGYEVEIETPN